MFKTLKHKFIILAAALTLALPLGVTAMASAQNTNLQQTIGSNGCSGSNLDISGSTSSGCDTSAGTSVNHLLTNVVNVFSVVVGLVAVIMIIVGGFRYIVSGGDSSNTASAKNAILFAIVGLVIVALAQVIVHFVLNKAVSTS